MFVLKVSSLPYFVFQSVDNIQANFEDKFKQMNKTIDNLKKENEDLKSKDKSKK